MLTTATVNSSKNYNNYYKNNYHNYEKSQFRGFNKI